MPVSLAVFFLMMNCSSSSKKKNISGEKEVKEQPRPGMEPQVDSLKKVLDEKRKNRNK